MAFFAFFLFSGRFPVRTRKIFLLFLFKTVAKKSREPCATRCGSQTLDARVIGCVGVIFSIAPTFPAGSKNRLFYAGIRPVLSLYFFPPILYFSIISPMPGVFQILSHTIVKGLFVETLIGATTLLSHATRDSWAVYNPCAQQWMGWLVPELPLRAAVGHSTQWPCATRCGSQTLMRE